MTSDSIGDRDAGESPRVRADGGDLTLDAVFRLLGDRRRRALLYYLAERGGPVDRGELARVIASEDPSDERETTGDRPTDGGPTDAEFTRALVSLDHVHLPRLAEDGVISYDRETGEVEPAGALARLRPYLELARDEESA